MVVNSMVSKDGERDGEEEEEAVECTAATKGSVEQMAVYRSEPSTGNS